MQVLVLGDIWNFSKGKGPLFGPKVVTFWSSFLAHHNLYTQVFPLYAHLLRRLLKIALIFILYTKNLRLMEGRGYEVSIYVLPSSMHKI